MMEQRTFKFRVWSKAANRFLHSHKNKGLIFGMGSSEDSDIEEFGGWDVGSCVEDKNLVVQQFTGLKDSKGVDVYEGDIVKFSKPTGIVHPVWDYLTVVGNIFENENA